MDANKMLRELTEERQRLDILIAAAQQYASGQKRRGRPPAWAAQPQAEAGVAGDPAKNKKKKEKSGDGAQSRAKLQQVPAVRTGTEG